MLFLGPEMGSCLRILVFLVVLGCCFNLAAGQDTKALLQNAFDLHQKGRFSEALPLLQRAYAKDPDDYFVNLLLGIDSLRTGQTKGAVPFLKKASQLRPKEEIPLDYLGEAYARQDIYGDAAEAYMKAMRVAPGPPDAARASRC